VGGDDEIVKLGIHTVDGSEIRKKPVHMEKSSIIYEVLYIFEVISPDFHPSTASWQ